MSAAPVPFTVDWPAAQVQATQDRVRAYRFPAAPEAADGEGWSYGCDAAFLRRLCAHWTDRYDAQAAVDELNRWPQFTARVEDFDLHFVHVVGEAQGRRPLLLTHGWPGSHYEFWQAIEPLAYPSRHGGDPADAFDLVIPSLPGFGFSSKPAKPFGQRATARLFNGLMTETLGHDRYLAQGGDWGCLVTGFLGLDHPQHVRAIHLNMLGLRPASGPQTDEEKAWAGQIAAAQQRLSAYFALQTSKPQSLAWAMADNPVGQAAWITERFHDWSDLNSKSFEEVFPLDRLLTNVMIYVMTDSFTTSVWYYRAAAEERAAALPDGVKVTVPTSFANYPGEDLYRAPPRSFAERAYEVVRWRDMPRGGHFAAMEEPGLFVDDLQDWARSAPA